MHLGLVHEGEGLAALAAEVRCTASAGASSGCKIGDHHPFTFAVFSSGLVTLLVVLGALHSATYAVSVLTMQGLSSDRFMLPRPPTRPEVLPPITSRYFGAGPIQVR